MGFPCLEICDLTRAFIGEIYNMNIQFKMPVDVIMRKNCVLEEIKRISALGSRAVIVADASAALESGAMDDVTTALRRSKIPYTVYNKPAGIPTFECAYDAARAAVSFGGEMIIAIGGGGTIDTGKAAALLAAQKAERSIADLMTGAFQPESIPLIAVPTAAGPGAEVTPSLVMISTASAQSIHMKHDVLFPRLALLDYKYTTTVPWGITVNSALEAIGHAIEADMAAVSPFVRAIARESLSNTGAVLTALSEDQVDVSIRQMMMYDSLLAGIAIGQTGASALHEIAHTLTRNRNIPYGRAVGLLIGPYLNFIRTQKSHLVSAVTAAMGLRDLDDFCQKISLLIIDKDHFSRQEIKEWVSGADISLKIADCAVPLSERDLLEIFETI